MNVVETDRYNRGELNHEWFIWNMNEAETPAAIHTAIIATLWEIRMAKIYEKSLPFSNMGERRSQTNWDLLRR